MTRFDSTFKYEQRLNALELDVRRYIGRLGARCVLLEACLKVIMAHDLLDEMVKEHAFMCERPPIEKTPPLQPEQEAKT